MFVRRMSRAVLGLTALTIALLSILGAGDARASAVIGNGTVQLGVNDLGNLGYAARGVYYVPTEKDGTRAGCLCEGWGAGNADTSGVDQFQGHANAAMGSDAELVSFTSTLETATSVSTVGSGRLKVTHEYAPFPGNSGLIEGKVTLMNLGASTLGDVRYTRLMDWDIEPTATDEFVTIRRGTTPALLFSNDDGFATGDPFEPRAEIAPGTTNVDFTDSGPNDHGALFDFGFGALAPGESTTFFIYYGAAGTTDDADAAVSAAGAEVYSYGKPNAGGLPNNSLNTFIFAFRGLGGAAVIPPTLALSPDTDFEEAGTPHTVTATLRDSADNPVPGSSIVFSVAGANPRAASTTTTAADGTVDYTYTGAAAGTDTITACLDADGDLVCGPTEVTDTATVTYQDTTGPETTIDSGPAEGSTVADATPAFEFSSSETGSTFECKLDDGAYADCDSPLTTGTLTDGPHTLSVRATDAVGNVTPADASRTFTVDTTAPETTIDAGPDEGSTTGDDTPEFEFSSSKLGSTFECTLDDGEPFDCDSPLTTDTLTDGPHTLSVRATDAVGKADMSPASRTFTVDTTAPETTIDSGPAAGSTIADSTPTFEFSSGEPNSTFECRVDDGEPFDCTSGLTLDALAPGEHTFSVTATDASGNSDGTPVIRAFSVAGPSVQPPAPTPVPLSGPAPVAVVPTPAVSRRCGSRRNFMIRLRPANKRLATAVVRVNGKKVRVSRDTNGRLRARVNLTSLKLGSYKVKIVARGKDGRRYKETRTYKTC